MTTRQSEAINFLREKWGDAAEAVIAECAKVQPFSGSSREFLEYCTACGGDWGAMLLTGIRKLWPTVWDAIPDNMGLYAWSCLCDTLALCGVDTSN